MKEKSVLIICDNTKCLWNITICSPEGISRNECNRGGFIHLGKHGECLDIEPRLREDCSRLSGNHKANQ